METKQAKLVATVLALVVLQVFSLSSLAQDEPRTPIDRVPYTIRRPGSYYLTKDLETTSGSQDAITVNADNVTIDLMGFSLIGRGSGTGCGIYINARKNVEIHRGTVRNFGGYGIREAKYATVESPSYGSGHRVVGVRVDSNGSSGIALSGVNHLVKDCTALLNGGDGIYVGNGCVVSNNISSVNDDDGIELGGGCLAFSNVVASNLWYGIYTFEGCLVIDNVSYYNDTGIYVEGNGSFIKDNTVSESFSITIWGEIIPSDGIYVKGTDNVIECNLVTSCSYGIYFEIAGNFYANNRGADNTTCFGGPGKPSSGSPGDGGGNVSF